MSMVVDTKKYKMREARPGRGYWSGGVWVDFEAPESPEVAGASALGRRPFECLRALSPDIH